MGSLGAMRPLFRDLAEELIRPERQGEGDQGDNLSDHSFYC